LAELTKREKLLVVMLSTIVNPMWNEKPWKFQYDIFRSLQAIHAPGKYSEDELKDLVESIHAVYQEIAGQANHMMSKAR